VRESLERDAITVMDVSRDGVRQGRQLLRQDQSTTVRDCSR